MIDKTRNLCYFLPIRTTYQPGDTMENILCYSIAIVVLLIALLPHTWRLSRTIAALAASLTMATVLSYVLSFYYGPKYSFLVSAAIGVIASLKLIMWEQNSLERSHKMLERATRIHDRAIAPKGEHRIHAYWFRNLDGEPEYLQHDFTWIPNQPFWWHENADDQVRRALKAQGFAITVNTSRKLCCT